MARKPAKSKCAICGGLMDDCAPMASICGKPDCVRERNRRKALKHGREKLWGLPKTCPVCGGTFNRSQERKKFCSDPCAKEGAREAARTREARKILKLGKKD